MRRPLRCVCCLLALLLGMAGCAHQSSERPNVYRGGEYYPDALHAGDLKKLGGS